MVVRFATSKGQWRKLRKLFPGKEEDPGRTAYDNRLVYEALLYMAREGCTWRALPEEFGAWGTISQRFYRWQEQGVFDSLFSTFIASRGINSLMVDGTIVKVHQHGTGARKVRGTPEDQAIGHSRGGRTTKILAASDENGCLLNFLLLPGNSGESPHVPELIRDIEAAEFIGDRAFDTDNIIEMLRSRPMEVVIPPKVSRRVQRQYDKEKYKTRHLIENLFQKLKVYRRIATRYEKTSERFTAFIIIAAVYIMTKTKESKLRKVLVAREWPLLRDRTGVIEVYLPEGLQRTSSERDQGLQ